MGHRFTLFVRRMNCVAAQGRRIPSQLLKSKRSKATHFTALIFMAFCVVPGERSFGYPGSLDVANAAAAYMERQQKAGNFSGAVLVARDGKVIFSRGYGFANREWAIRNTPRTKFKIGSITKQFTAAAILLLQDEGKLRVTDPVCRHLPRCPAGWSDITIHHLLTHTSGIPDYLDARSPEDRRRLYLMGAQSESLLETIMSQNSEFLPGERMKYSNSGYFLLGKIIEQVSGGSYSDYLSSHIFRPLNMRDTGHDDSSSIIARRAAGYSIHGNDPVNTDFVDMSVPYAAGALYSTTEDLYRWYEALFNNRLLSASGLGEMLTVNKNLYAYGVIVTQIGGRTLVNHGGQISGFRSFLGRFPTERVTIVVLENVDFGTPDQAVVALNLAAAAFGEPYVDE